MCLFKIPKYVYREIDSTKRIFSSDNKQCNIGDHHSPIQSIAWNKIYRFKYEGGLAIRKTENINAAYLAK